MGDKESREYDAKLDELIEKGLICQSCGKNLNKNTSLGIPTDCNNCRDKEGII